MDFQSSRFSYTKGKMASELQQQVEVELQKLLKKDLIYYVIYRKLPDGVVSSLSEPVVQFLVGAQQDGDSSREYVSVTTEQEVCRSLHCLNQKADLRVSECELKAQTRLVQELESSILNLNTIISLLRNQNKSEVNRNNNNTVQQSRISQGRNSQQTGRGRQAAGKLTPSSVEAARDRIIAVGGSTGDSATRNSRGQSASVGHSPEVSVNASQPTCGERSHTFESNPITSHQVSKAIHEAQSHLIMSDIISGGESSQKGDWHTVDYRKKRSRAIVGTQDRMESSSTLLEGVPRMAVLHVYRLSPNTTVDVLKGYLTPTFPEVLCERIQSRQPERYASFKVSIFERNFKRAMDPQLWPKDCYVQRFFFRKRMEQSAR